MILSFNVAVDLSVAGQIHPREYAKVSIKNGYLVIDGVMIAYDKSGDKIRSA